MKKEIATLPPLEQLSGYIPLSPRTGQPRRPWTVALAAILSYLVVPAIGLSYGWHYYLAAYQATYPKSAQLTIWLAPAPGKALSLALEVCYAALIALASGLAGFVGFNAWNGKPWVRWAVAIPLVFTILTAILLNFYAFIGFGLVLLVAVLLFLRPTTHYFELWERVRNQSPELYRSPETVFYGRLPRYR